TASRRRATRARTGPSDRRHGSHGGLQRLCSSQSSLLPPVGDLGSRTLRRPRVQDTFLLSREALLIAEQPDQQVQRGTDASGVPRRNDREIQVEADQLLPHDGVARLGGCFYLALRLDRD